jgi:hypothetical protein
MFTGSHKEQRMTLALPFLNDTTKMATNFSVASFELTDDETRVLSVNFDAVDAHTFTKQAERV